jgi:hypothetical protein
MGVGYRKLGRRVSILLSVLGLILGVTTVILGINEATLDVWDPIGSNYWLAYASIISGAVIIVFIASLARRSKK